MIKTEPMERKEYLKWDKDYQNGDGNTALHVAISTDADMDTLKALLEKGADVNVTNDNGKTPFECINHGSWQTAINLLKLEKSLDLSDEYGDTFLHVLMDRVGDSVWGVRRTVDGEEEFSALDQDQITEKFWNYILGNVEQFDIKLNKQNQYGSTPLHIAADYWPSMRSLEVMLSQFQHVNPFITDNTGDNFLHRFFSRHRRMYASQIQDKLIKGELTYLPRETITQLLNSQNKDKNTPLHIHIKLVDGRTISDVEDMLGAGADPNISDWIGDTALHCIFKKYMNQLEEDTDTPDEIALIEFLDDYRDKAIQYFVQHGAGVNAKNHRGESPIFLANNQQHITTLVNLGADVNIKNNLQQTPLLYLVSKEKVNLNTLENLLKLGASVFVCDVHGNTVLHYIAWHGYHENFLPALKEYKVKATPDNLGQLPCDVAYIQGHKTVFDDVCECKTGTHTELQHFSLTNSVIELSELVKTPEKFQEMFDRIRRYRGPLMSKILSLPEMGAVGFEGEAADIKTVTKQIVESICAKLTEKNEFWKCRITQSGSVGENTKVNSPNEFDFVIVLEKLGEICFVDEQSTVEDQGYAYLKLKPECATDEYSKFFNKENYLDTFKVRHELEEILDEIYTTESAFQHPNISFVVGNNKAIISPTFNFTFYWKGCLYKELLVDVDLVPACQVQQWWPADCNIDRLEGDTETLIEQGAILLLQTEVDEDNEAQSKLRVSAMSAEKEHMLNLPQVARDAYKVCKILCNSRICPDLHLKADIPVKKVVTSYMMKNALFHTIEDIRATQHIKSDPTESRGSNFDENFELSEVVRNIFLKLLKFSKEENLPSFVLPWQNVFTFNSKVTPHHNHYFCAFRYCFIKVILAMLGEKVDFSDIDVTSCTQAVRDRDVHDGMYEDVDKDDDTDEQEMIEDLSDSLTVPKFRPYMLL